MSGSAGIVAGLFWLGRECVFSLSICVANFNMLVEKFLRGGTGVSPVGSTTTP